MNTIGWIILGVISGLGLVVGILFVLLRVLKQQSRDQAVFLEKKMREEMQFNQDQFLKLAQERFAVEQNKAVTELETRKQAVESSVQGLNAQLEKYKNLMHEFEQDRSRKYGNLENELKNASQATVKLQETTSHLNNILGNVKLRGQWGERMAEDIIQYAGLIEGVNYKKQKKQETVATKPDYTFLLPDEHRINMDVKFPLDNYMKMVNASDPLQKDLYQKEFIKNVKDRIKEIQNRDYINPGENTLDFVLLFIPNEQVFGLIQEAIPELLDMALKQKVVLCSPFTLYAMLSVIRQGYENFRYEKDMKKIILLIDQFLKHYERFKGRFEDIGGSLTKLETQYSDLRDKSFKQMDTKIKHIESYKKGNNVVEISPPVQTQEGLLTEPAAAQDLEV